MTTTLMRSRSADIQDELDQARRRGPLQQLVIPPCPDLLLRLQDALAQPEPDLNAVARIASSDVAMAATLMRAANSPLHAVGQPVATIGQAMNRLGLRNTAALLTGFLVQRSIKVDSPHLQRFWERAAKQAVAMAFIAEHLPGLSPDLAHTCGLFCHVGLPVLLQSMKGYGGTLVEARARRDRSFTATENANHRTDHTVVGALVAKVWQVSPTVVAAIRLHHDLSALGGESVEPEVQTLMAASLVAEHLMRRHEGLDPERDWVDHAEAAMGWLHIDQAELTHWEEQVFFVLDAV